jgi:membrane-associated protease RseP (regulator of RpoE activity)
MSKIRMLGAGITNNIVVGFICFGLLFLVLGNAAPVDVPLVKAVYNEYPAAYAGVPPNSIIRSINGIDVATRDDVAAILNRSRPGEQVTLVTEKDHQRSAYLLTLARWPDAAGERTGGFMGVSYYDAPSVKRVFDNLATPFGFFFLMAIPIEIILNPVGWQHFMILINDTTDAVAWSVPFPQYWLIVQILFWCAWFNISVGLCNALPMIPLDGGYILKEGVDRLLDCRGILKYSGYVVTVVSYAMLMILVLLFTLPYLFRAAGMS